MGGCVTVAPFAVGLTPFFLNILIADVVGIAARAIRLSAMKQLHFIGDDVVWRKTDTITICREV